MYKDTAVSLSF